MFQQRPCDGTGLNLEGAELCFDGCSGRKRVSRRVVDHICDATLAVRRRTEHASALVADVNLALRVHVPRAPGAAGGAVNAHPDRLSAISGEGRGCPAEQNCQTYRKTSEPAARPQNSCFCLLTRLKHTDE